MVISPKVLHSQTSYLVPRYNTIISYDNSILDLDIRSKSHTSRSKVTDVEVSALSECLLFSNSFEMKTSSTCAQLDYLPIESHGSVVWELHSLTDYSRPLPSFRYSFSAEATFLPDCIGEQTIALLTQVPLVGC